MASQRLRALVAFVVVMSVLQVFVEDVMVFLGATGGVQSGALGSRYVMMAIPLTISILLFVVLVGGAVLSTNSLR